MRNVLLLFLLSLALLITSCGESRTETFSVSGDVVLEGPLFEGPNTGQLVVDKELSEFLKSIGANPRSIKSVKLVKAQFSKDVNFDSDIVSDAGMTFASANTEMLQAASLNPVPVEVPTAELNTSTEIDLDAFFKDQSFIVLLDLGLKEDIYDNYEAKVALEFELTIKE